MKRAHLNTGGILMMSGPGADESAGLVSTPALPRDRTAVAVFTTDGVLTEANPSAFDIVGLTPAEVFGQRYDTLEPISHRRDVVERVGKMLQTAAAGHPVRQELPLQLAGGRVAMMDCMATPLRDKQGRTTRIIATGVEITDRKAAEVSLRRMTRALRMLRACNQVLAEAAAEEGLLGRICQTIVDAGEYTRAWIGRAADDKGRAVHVIASAGGHDDAFMERCASSLALRFVVGDERMTLNICSQLQEAFEPSETMLLKELAADLERSLHSLRALNAHARAEERLQLFRKVLDEATDAIYIVDLETGRIVDANAAVSRRLGYDRAELLRMSLTDLSVTAGQTSWEERVRLARECGSFTVEGEHRRQDGEIVPVEIGSTYVEHRGHPYLITVARDISDRQRHLTQIARLARVSRLQAAVNDAILRIRDRNELLAEACRLATEVGGYDRAVVSLVDPDGRHARPIFRAGHGDDFPEPDLLSIGDGTEPDTCLSGLALRTGEIAVCSDLSNSEPAVAMREKLIALGYRAVIAIPLIVEGHRLGAMTLALRECDIDWDEELPLLKDMGATLSFALRAQGKADEVQLLAYYDPLTGLANRALLCKRLSEAIAQPDNPAKPPAVAAFDVHHLSKINDSYGRRFGDLLLQQVAARLRHHTEDEQRIGYIGGGTFVLVEPELVSSDENIVSLLESTVFAEPFTVEGRTLRVTFRSGLARYPRDGIEADALIQKAEAALRHAKETGEQYIHYALDVHSQMAQRIALENRLHTALDEQQFEIHYQPQIGMQSGRIEAVEALLRWNDPERGLVPPSEFLPLLEASAMIVPVGNWVLARALGDCRRWAALGLPPVRVAVNVSPLQVRRRNFVPLVLDLLRLNLPQPCGFGLDVEITETVVLQDVEGASRKLHELRDAGVRIALDDFGTGYSSLGLLSKLPVDLLKIDRSFVSGLPHDTANELLVRSIVKLASAFKLLTVAEGVETRQQMELLREIGCDQTQGYLHCRPVSARRIENLLRAHHEN